MTSPLMLGSSPLALLLNAPLCGIHPNARAHKVIHAIEHGQVPIMRATGTAACGRQGVKVMGVSHPDGKGTDDVLSMPWPTQKRGLPERYERCDECWNLTGRKRPRITFKTAAPIANAPNSQGREIPTATLWPVGDV